MTDHERALLLAVAKRCESGAQNQHEIRTLIAAVGAEAAPDPLQATLDAFGKILHAAATGPEPLTEAKSCETCSSYLLMYDKCLYPRDGECLPTHKYWQPKPTEADVCPTCGGNGDISVGNGMYPDCYDCDGTGKKETK